MKHRVRACAVRRGLEQPSARPQSVTQVNTIRPGKLARLLGMREAKSAKRAEPAGLTEHGKGVLLGLVRWLVVEWGTK
jgi:hypothetical protein